MLNPRKKEKTQKQKIKQLHSVKIILNKKHTKQCSTKCVSTPEVSFKKVTKRFPHAKKNKKKRTEKYTVICEIVLINSLQFNGHKLEFCHLTIS